MPANAIATTAEEAEEARERIGLPAIVRPAFTLGGRGGGIARTEEEYRTIVARGLAASPITQVLIDQSVIGWGEFELEVMRDHNDNVVIVCSIENLDPMGVHTGDSVTVAPQQTLTDRLYNKLRDQAMACIRAVGVETGGSNVQFAVNPSTEEILVIEMNPRVSRSSRAGLQGHRLPDRQDRRAPGRRVLAGGDPQRHHAGHAGELRADDRLRGRQVAALRLREVQRRQRRAVDAHEVRRRGDGHRPHLLPGVPEGHALARARLAAAPGRARRRDAAGHARAPDLRSLRRHPRGLPQGGHDRGDPHQDVHRPVVPARAAGRRARSRRAVQRRPDLQGRRHLRGGVRRRDAVLLLGLGAPGGRRGPPRRQRLGGHPRRRAQPHRPGHRVRLLLRARRDDRPRERPRRGDDQLQPRDRLDRLRHLGPPVLRAADAGGRARRHRDREARSASSSSSGARPR